jgi:hypothetical protein
VKKYQIAWKNTRLAGKIPDWLEKYQTTLLENQSTNLVFPMKIPNRGYFLIFYPNKITVLGKLPEHGKACDLTPTLLHFLLW